MATITPSVVQLAPLAGTITHNVEVAFSGFWHMVVSGIAGLLAGTPLGMYLKNRGVSGTLTDVKTEVAKVKQDVSTLQAQVNNAPQTAPVVAVATPAS